MSSPRRSPVFDEWLAITSVLNLYATAIDDQDFDRLSQVFGVDLVADYKAFQVTGAVAMVDTMRRAHRGLRTQHVITNAHVEVSDDGREAWTRAYITARLRRPGDPSSLYSMGGCYTDRLTLTPEGWRIVERTARGMWQRGTSPTPDPSE